MIGEFLELLEVSSDFPFFDFQPLKAWHSLHLGTERYMTTPGGATFSSVRPTTGEVGIFGALNKEGGGPQCCMSILRNGHVVSIILIFILLGSMLHVDFIYLSIYLSIHLSI